MPEVSDADQHYFARVAEDCKQLLGTEIELRELELDTNAEIVLRLRYRLGPADWTSEGHGETVIGAHAALREQLVLDRIRLGVRAMVRQPRQDTHPWSAHRLAGGSAKNREGQIVAIGGLDAVFEGEGIDYWVFGGWALDFRAGQVTRDHADIFSVTTSHMTTEYGGPSYWWDRVGRGVRDVIRGGWSTVIGRRRQ